MASVTGTARPAGPDGAGDLPRGRRPGRRTRTTAAVLGVVAAGGLVAGLVTGPLAGDGGAEREARTPGRSVLPPSVAGLPARGPGPADEVAAELTTSLASEPSVADVAVRVYGEGQQVMVVLHLTPRTPFTDETAGALTARLLGAAGPQRGMSSDVRSAATDDGLALVTCSTPRSGAATCVSVEADRALVVVTTGSQEDPVELASEVRDEVVGAG